MSCSLGPDAGTLSTGAAAACVPVPGQGFNLQVGGVTATAAVAAGAVGPISSAHDQGGPQVTNGVRDGSGLGVVSAPDIVGGGAMGATLPGSGMAATAAAAAVVAVAGAVAAPEAKEAEGRKEGGGEGGGEGVGHQSMDPQPYNGAGSSGMYAFPDILSQRDFSRGEQAMRSWDAYQAFGKERVGVLSLMYNVEDRGN